MRYPIKLNRNTVPLWVSKILPAMNDPRILCDPDIQIGAFEESISSIKIGTTWKTTKKNRHVITDKLIAELVPRFPKLSILEIGASSGATSLDLLNCLGNHFYRYYVTDLFFSLPYHVTDVLSFFYHPKFNQCIMSVSDCWLAYEDIAKAIFPLGLLAKSVLSRAPKFDKATAKYISMLHPDLKIRVESDNRIVVQEYDIFTPWPKEAVDVVKVANVLNRQYFTDKKIKVAIANLCTATKAGGKLVVTDNRDVESISIFIKNLNGKLDLVQEINGGTEIQKLILNDCKT